MLHRDTLVVYNRVHCVNHGISWGPTGISEVNNKSRLFLFWTSGDGLYPNCVLSKPSKFFLSTGAKTRIMRSPPKTNAFRGSKFVIYFINYFIFSNSFDSSQLLRPCAAMHFWHLRFLNWWQCHSTLAHVLPQSHQAVLATGGTEL